MILLIVTICAGFYLSAWLGAKSCNRRAAEMEKEEREHAFEEAQTDGESKSLAA